MEIKEYLKKIITKEDYDLWIEPVIELTTKAGTAILEVPNIYYETKISEILKTQNLSAEIITRPPQNLKVTEQKSTEVKPPLSTKTLQMEKPYGKEKVATSEIINSKFFAYPTSRKTKYGVTKITFNDQKYIVHRGKKSPDPDEEPIGQLDTNHLRILLAIIHTWQEQNCKFFGVQALIELSVTLREIAKKIGYQIRGQNIKWLQKKVEELTKYPITLERKLDGKASSFTFLNELTTLTEQKPYTKKILKITLNPILSQELSERRAILRNKDCYKIKNPTALKFLLTYDKRIYTTQDQFKLNLENIAEELELKGKKQNILKVITKVIKNLNGYKITESEEITLELVKEGRERYLAVGKREIVQSLPEGTVPISLST
ncbi:MAG: hypothetical protein LBD56_01660 [Endomicrobium sp.]|jgi:hypothetical protein|nr:hypothetical protein [Endomicrobium sp.]